MALINARTKSMETFLLWVLHGVVSSFIAIACFGYWYEHRIKPSHGQIQQLSGELIRHVNIELEVAKAQVYAQSTNITDIFNKTKNWVNENVVSAQNKMNVRLLGLELQFRQDEIERNQAKAYQAEIMAFQVEIIGELRAIKAQLKETNP